MREITPVPHPVCVITRLSSAPVAWATANSGACPRSSNPLPDPLGRGQPPLPLLIPADAGWENSEIWTKPPPEPEPPPEAQPDANQGPPPF
jgi:hypothetical protein